MPWGLSLLAESVVKEHVSGSCRGAALPSSQVRWLAAWLWNGCLSSSISSTWPSRKINCCQQRHPSWLLSHRSLASQTTSRACIYRVFVLLSGLWQPIRTSCLSCVGKSAILAYSFNRWAVAASACLDGPGNSWSFVFRLPVALLIHAGCSCE